MKYRDLIRAAIEDEMKNDHNVICYGLGVTDPKDIWNNDQSA